MPRRILSKPTEKKSWKFVQSKQRQNKRTKVALLVLVLVVGVLITSRVTQMAQSLFRPLGAVNGERSYVWNGEFNINLLVKATRVSLISYNPKEEKITIIEVPDELFLDVPYGFGKWQLRAIYELGQSQKEIGGNRLLKDTLSLFFAVPIDGFLDFTLQPTKTTLEVVEILRKNSFSGLNLLSFLKTDLTLWEILRLKMSLSGVRFDKVKELDLMRLGVWEKENLPDGTEVLTADPVKLDSVLSDFADPVIVSEHKTIAVFNATERAALAGQWARVINNLGGNVIITSNAKQKLDKTKIAGEKSLTLKRIRQILGSLDCQNNPKCDIINTLDEEVNSSRAQINLILGEDYLKKN